LHDKSFDVKVRVHLPCPLEYMIGLKEGESFSRLRHDKIGPILELSDQSDLFAAGCQLCTQGSSVSASVDVGTIVPIRLATPCDSPAALCADMQGKK